MALSVEHLYPDGPVVRIVEPDEDGRLRCPCCQQEFVLAPTPVGDTVAEVMAALRPGLPTSAS